LNTLQLVGYEKLEVRIDPPALRKTMDQVEIDLSAIAKGYAVDQAAQVLFANDVHNFLVEIGGEIRCAGNRSPGENWLIGIETPRSDRRSATTFLSLGDASIASSGDYRNFFEVDGVRYSHTIDPRSGRPVRHQIAASTVWADNCATADAHATALMVMGDRALAWCDDNGVGALLFERRGSAFVMHRSSSFPDLIVETPVPEPVKSSSSFWRLATASAVVFGVALAAMAIGVILSNRCIKGSCGGMAGLTDEQGRPLCEGCTKPSTECSADPSLRKHAPTDGSTSG
jgi:thiamine biosynthesis lipoprotein